MPDLLANISLGLSTALSLENLLYCLLGVSLGTVIGVIPGMGALATMSILFPITFHLDATTALIMLAGIWYGSTYGGSTTSILLNLPGTLSTAVTCIDGYPMAKQGRAGVALLMTTIASFVGASVGIVLMMLFSEPLATLAQRFGPWEYFALMLMGLVGASVVSDGSPINSIAMVVLGIILGVAGMDYYTGTLRFTFGVPELMDGISLVALAMGLFGISEVITSVRTVKAVELDKKISLRSMLPTRDDVRRSWMPSIRGASIGSLFGVMPGVGSSVAAFMAYALEKKSAKDPTRFGKGAVEGVVAPETSNSAADITSFIPTMALGVPGSANMALILAVLIVHGINPGPSMIADQPALFWGLIMSFWIGNLFLLVLNIPLIGVWIRILNIPYHILYPSIVVFVCIGVYTINFSAFDVVMVAVIGALGYFMRVLALPAAPLLLGFVLGPMMEEHFRRAMIISRGNMETFFTRPISAIFITISFVMIAWGIWSAVRDGWRQKTMR